MTLGTLYLYAMHRRFNIRSTREAEAILAWYYWAGREDRAYRETIEASYDF